MTPWHFGIMQLSFFAVRAILWQQTNFPYKVVYIAHLYPMSARRLEHVSLVGECLIAPYFWPVCVPNNSKQMSFAEWHSLCTFHCWESSAEFLCSRRFFLLVKESPYPLDAQISSQGWLLMLTAHRSIEQFLPATHEWWASPPGHGYIHSILADSIWSRGFETICANLIWYPRF